MAKEDPHRYPGRKTPAKGVHWQLGQRWLGVSRGSVVICFSTLKLAAAVVFDGSLGIKGELNGPDYMIRSDYGQQAGPNLFHSFSRFSLARGESATFTGPTEVQNILTRVTGGEMTTIDGSIRSTISKANFYFINPAGILLGPNAKLDVSGSVAFSSANYLRTGEGRFPAANESSVVLSSAPVEAFGFLSHQPGSIQIDGSRIRVADGATLSIVGGDIDAAGGMISAPGGRIAVASVQVPGEIMSNNLATEESEGGTIQLRGGTVLQAGTGQGPALRVDPIAIAHSDSVVTEGGKIEIRTGRLHLDHSAIYESAGARDSTLPGSINIMAGGEVTLRNGSHIAATTRTDASGAPIHIQSSRVLVDERSMIKSSTASGNGRSGDIEIEANRIDVLNGSELGGDSFGPGNTGDVILRASELRVGSDGVPLETTVGTSSFSFGSGGKAGNVWVEADRLKVFNQPGGALVGLGSRTFGKEPSGNVHIDAGLIEVDGNNANGLLIGQPAAEQTAIGSVNFTKDAGQSGNVEIRAEKLKVMGFGIISAATFGQGDAGTIRIDATEIELDDSSIVSSTARDSAGAGGNVQVRAEVLEIRNRGGIAARTSGNGDAGNVEVMANRVHLDFGAISADVMPNSNGRGGEVRVGARELVIRNGGGIFASTAGPGNAGDVSVMAEAILIDGREQIAPFSTATTATTFASTGIGSQTLLREGEGGRVKVTADSIRVLGMHGAISAESFGTGHGGSVELRTGNLILEHGGSITSSSTSSGNSGRISVEADHAIALTGRSAISTAAKASNGEGIALRAGDKIEVHDSRISSQAANDGGEVRLDAQRLVLFREADINSRAGRHGGNILIDPQFVVIDKTLVDASATQGRGGNIGIATRYYIASADSRLTVTSRFGIDGQISILGPSIDLTGSIAGLPSTLLVGAPALPEHCGVKLGGDLSSFLILGRGSPPWRAEGWLPSWPTKQGICE